MSCPFCKKEHEYGVEEALRWLEEGPRKVRGALAGAGRDEVWFPEPRSGGVGWSAAQVLSHLADCEMVFGVRFRKMLSEDEPELPAFDQNRFASLTGGRDADDLLAGFELLRKQNLALVRAAGPGALDRAGRHPEYGRLTLREHLIHIAEHDAKHAAQIRRVRTAWQATATEPRP